jgi:hypothetical protein
LKSPTRFLKEGVFLVHFLPEGVVVKVFSSEVPEVVAGLHCVGA